MEILPGVGLPVARVGQTVDEIEAAAGPATRADDRRAVWEQHSPPFAVYLDDRGTCELVEVCCATDGGPGATLGGVQLTHRLMDDVEADLARSGLRGRRSRLVVDFELGFTLWSLDEAGGPDGGPEVGHDVSAGRLLVEGVAIAPLRLLSAC